MPRQPLKIVVVPSWEGTQAIVDGTTVYIAAQRTPEAAQRLAELVFDREAENLARLGHVE